MFQARVQRASSFIQADHAHRTTDEVLARHLVMMRVWLVGYPTERLGESACCYSLAAQRPLMVRCSDAADHTLPVSPAAHVPTPLCVGVCVHCCCHHHYHQVVAGAPGSRLVDLVVSPQALVQQDSARSALRLNATYYITKQVGLNGREGQYGWQHRTASVTVGWVQ